MAKLIIQGEDGPDQVVELGRGPQRIGRDPANDIVLLHPSVSSHHCVIELQDEGLLVHDLGSTNGTDLDGEPVLQAWAQTGQVIGIGSFNCRIDEVPPPVSIPTWEEPPPPDLPPGVKPCDNHPEFPASMKCTHCNKLFCGSCIHLMRRLGGELHKLCPICSHHCIPIDGMNAADGPGKIMNFLKGLVRPGAKSGTMRLSRGRTRRRRRSG